MYEHEQIQLDASRRYAQSLIEQRCTPQDFDCPFTVADLDADAQRGFEQSCLSWLHYYWRKVHPEDRLRFLVEMLTPNERRVLALGFEDEA
jgi:hypothetical protein